MTVLNTMNAVPRPDIRPVPWRRLAWVAWRQSRTTFIATAGIVGVLALYYLISGQHIHSAYAALQGCHPHTSPACQFMNENFFNRYSSTGPLGFIQNLAPIIIGAFIGAPVVSRELETGTVRYAWTQGVGRLRWTLALLIAGAAVTVAAMVVFGAAVAWRYQPLVAAGVIARLDPPSFSAAGPAVVGWGLASFGIGVLAGLLWRRVVAAVATTIVVGFGLAVLTSQVLRLHYLSPLTTTRLQLSQKETQISQWWTKAGVRVTDSQLNEALRNAGVQGSISSGGTHSQAAPGTTGTDPLTYLVHHGYTQWTSYQPASRYWTFQWIEFGWLTALALIALTTTVVLLRRRDA